MVTYFMGGAWLVLLIAIYGIWFVFKQLYVAEGKKLEQAQSAYSQLSNHLVTNQKLRYRVKLVSQILDDRFEYSHAFRVISTLFPPSVVLNRFELQNDGSFLVDAAVDQHSLMDEVEKKVIEINQGKSVDFSAATLQQLSVSGSQWSFSLHVKLR